MVQVYVLMWSKFDNTLDTGAFEMTLTRIWAACVQIWCCVLLWGVSKKWIFEKTSPSIRLISLPKLA